MNLIEKESRQHTVDFNKSAIGCPSIDSEQSDAAELIFSTTKFKKKQKKKHAGTFH